MRLSPAPNNYPSGLRPVAAAGAGGQFATDPRLTSWDEDVGFAAREDDADRTGTSPERVGGISFSSQCRPRLGIAWHALSRLNVTPRNGDNFSGLAIASPGWARQRSAGRGNSATRGDIAGQFSRPGEPIPCEALQGGPWPGETRRQRHRGRQSRTLSQAPRSTRITQGNGRGDGRKRMKEIKLKITGIRPLVLHNGLMADPTNQFTIAIKKITAKGSKKMTTSDYAERDRLEWEAGLYWSTDEGGIAIPSDNIERCLQDGAKKSRLGKDFAAAVFVSEPEVALAHRMAGKSKEEIYANPAYTLRKGVKVQLSRIIRIRPMIPTGWSLEFTVEFDETIVNRQAVIDASKEAGSIIGLGDWRPKFGRFTAEVV